MTGPYEPPTPPPPPPPPAPPGWAVGAAGSAPSGRAPAGEASHAGAGAVSAEVPDLDDRERVLDRRVVTVWRFSTVTSLLVPSLMLSAVSLGFLGTPTGWVVPAVLLVAIVVMASWYPGARYDRWRWRLTDLAVELERGVVVRQAEALPYFRIQQIDVTQGPIDRLLGLASLQVTSASASGSVTLPGIAATDAPGIRRALLARAAAAVGDHDTGVRDAV